MNDTGRETAEALYEAGKQGLWDQVARAFAGDGTLAGAAVRYRKPSSGWTLLHQAAFWRNRDAARLCLHYGAVLDAEAKGKETPAEVAVARSDAAMAAWLRRAVVSGLWRPVEDPALRAASNLCSSLSVDAGRRIATEDFLVAYLRRQPGRDPQGEPLPGGRLGTGAHRVARDLRSALWHGRRAAPVTKNRGANAQANVLAPF